MLVRLSSFTHAFNSDQRLVEVEFRRDKEDAERLRCFMPQNPAVAIVGHYLCFILDGNRVPSHGKFMQVCPAASVRPGFPGRFRDLADLIGERNFRIDPDIFRRAINIAELLSPQEDEDDE